MTSHSFKKFRRISFFVVLFAALGTPAWADDVSATSHVAAATIFPDRALVTREAKVHVTAGAHTIVLADVPPGLDESSLRVQGKADAAVKIGSVEVKRIFLTEAANTAQRDKLTAIEARQDEKAVIDAEVKALESREALIDRIVANGADKTDANGTTKLDFTPEKWAQAWGLVQTGMAETQKDLVAKNIARRKLDEQIAQLQQELQQIQSSQAKERRDVRVNVEAEADTELNMSLTYQTFGAHWAPVYDARLDTGNGALALEQYGQASQQTGEDWTNVELTFSTAQPAQGSEMPKLGQWIVRLYQEVTAQLAAPAAATSYFMEQSKKATRERERMALSTGGSALPTPIGQNAGIEEKDAEPQQAVAQTSEYAAEFRVPGKADLKSTSDPTKMFIGAVHMTATLNAQLTPRLAAQAYLFAKAVNGEKYPLIPGMVAKYRDGAFIGNATMPLLRPGETANLSFGVDDRIKVTYHRSHEEQNNPTLILVGDMDIQRQYETKVQNLHKDPIDVTIFEQYPVAADPDVKSELIDDTTTPGYGKDPENRQGVIAWTAKLMPQEEKVYTIGFRVKYPKDRQLIGL